MTTATASLSLDAAAAESSTTISPPNNDCCSTMAACLDEDNPVLALQHLAKAAATSSTLLSQQLLQDLTLHHYQHQLPAALATDTNQESFTAACAASTDSIQHSLTKIASGGSAASQEIRALEVQKNRLQQECEAVQLAVQLRQDSVAAAQALSAQSLQACAGAVRPWLLWQQKQETEGTSTNDEDSNSISNRTRQYAGEYCLQQLAVTHVALSQKVQQQYQAAVTAGDLQTLGQLTPVLSQLQLSDTAVRLYLQFLKLSVLEPAMQQAVAVPQQGQGQQQVIEPPFQPMARVYNAAVQTLRHHLPLTSHCLHEAAGDVAVVQLVHLQTERAILPLLELSERTRHWRATSNTASRIYDALQERCGAYNSSSSSSSLMRQDAAAVADNYSAAAAADDCGFSHDIGSLPDVDAALEEAATCLQHAESYTRFVQHCSQQVQHARLLRFQQAAAAVKRERERAEWNQGGGGPKRRSNSKDADTTAMDDDVAAEDAAYQNIEILPLSTPLDQAVAELGGHYANIERCLLLASMQRAFLTAAHNDHAAVAAEHGSGGGPGGHGAHYDARYYRPLSLGNSGSDPGGSSTALQTALVETCLYAARRGTQRAFATGHTGTASAMTNFCVDCLQNVLLEVLSHRAEESGVALLKPGDGLLVGSAGIFNATSNLIRQGTNVSNVVIRSHKDEVMRKQQVYHGIARACATINDLEVAVFNTLQLETVLADATAKGFPVGVHATEQLQMCVKSLSTVTDAFKIASDGTLESLVSVLKPRIRSIVGEAIGGEGGGASAATAFMGSSVMTSEKVTVRMNYNLDEDAYNLQQLSEGYVARLCALLDELLEPVRLNLAPRLWDAVLIGVIATACKRLETSLRNKCEYTALGALSLDSDMRDLLHYTKDHLYGEEYRSNVAVAKACPPLNRLLQITKLLNVDDLEDVLDLISSSKRKGNWDLKLDDAKAYLSLRVEFESANVNELLRLPDE